MGVLVFIHQRSDDEQTYKSFLGLLIISILVWSLPAEVLLFHSIRATFLCRSAHMQLDGYI